MTGFLDSKRKEIAETDLKIVQLLRKRLDLALEIGRYKADHGLDIRDSAVEENVVGRYRKAAEENGMDPDLSERICRLIMEESVAGETALKQRAENDE